MSSIVYNMDCMIGMKQYPDNYFDLAIVDPVYGDVTKGGYMNNIDSISRKAKAIHYHMGLWQQGKTTKEYFDELFRVSKNQVVWGGIALPHQYSKIVNVGWCGIKDILMESNMPIAN